ncbi:MAG: hypothetical protein K2W94_07025 [Alphaproteobacteria bacterium]|nr:hypothetical protein [Alphaproteobacteria bacterium]
MHEKEDVIYVNNNSYFQKIVSSIVLISFLSMTVTQSYAMTEGLMPGDSSSKPNSSSSRRVFPAPDFVQKVENKASGDIEMGNLSNNQLVTVRRYTDPRKVTPLTNLDNAGSGVEIALGEQKTEVLGDKTFIPETTLVPEENRDSRSRPSQKPLLEQTSKDQKDDSEEKRDEETGKPKVLKKDGVKAEEDDECEDPKFQAWVKASVQEEVSSTEFRKAMGALVMTLALGYVIRSEVNWWIESFLNQFDTTYVGFKFMYMNPYGAYFINQLENWDIANVTLTLLPFINKMSYRFIDKLFPAQAKSNVQMQYANWIKTGGAVGVIAAASSVALSAAFQLYSQSVVLSASRAANMTPFLAAFLFMVNCVLYDDLKNSLLTLAFISMAPTWATLSGNFAKTEEEKNAAKTKLEAAQKHAENLRLIDKALEGGIIKTKGYSDEEMKSLIEDTEKLEDQPIKKLKRLLGRKKVEISSQEETEGNNQLTVTARQESLKTMPQAISSKSNKLGIGIKEAAKLAEFHKKLKQAEASRNRRAWAAGGFGTVLAGLAAYFIFTGTQEVADAGLQASVPGNLNQLGAANYHSFYEAQYGVWREDTSDIRTPPLTEMGGYYTGGTYVNGTNVNGTYVDGYYVNQTYTGGTLVNVDALNKWWTKCVNSAQAYQYVNNSVGSNKFSFGYYCLGNSYLNTWTANRDDLDPDMGIVWYNYFDGDFSGLAGVKNGNTNDDELIKFTPLQVSPSDKGVADTIAGIRAASSGALTFKAVGDVINPEETLISTINGALVNGLYETITTNPIEMFTAANLANLGWVGLSVLGVLGILALSSLESLLYASPTAMSAWISNSGMKDQGLMWTLVGSSGLSTAISVFPSFKETFSNLPHDLMKVVHYTGVLKHGPAYLAENTVSKLTGISSKKSITYYRKEFIERLKTLRDNAKSVTPEMAQSMVETLGLNKIVRARR